MTSELIQDGRTTADAARVRSSEATPSDDLVDWPTTGDGKMPDALDDTVAPMAPSLVPTGNRHHRRVFGRNEVRSWLCQAVDVRISRAPRLRLLAWTLVGVTCLWIARGVAPRTPSLMVLPSSPAHWAAIALGLAGMWLAPGMWISALWIRSGANLAAWWSARLASTLVWYALVGPAIHYLGRGAWVTTTGILLATTVSSLAVAAGTALGALTIPRVRWQRLVVAALFGGIAVQVGVTLAMRWWSGDMNYSHIRRFDWLIVVAAVVLALGGTVNRPALPSVVRARHARSLLSLLALVVATIVAVVLVNVRWSPAQQMPSAFGMQPIAAPAGSDAAFDLSAIGPDGPSLIREARFSVTTGEGVPVPAATRVSEVTAGRATLLVTIPPEARVSVCRSDGSTRLIVRDARTLVHMQAVLGSGWCAS
jgi:hypothetical protein